MHEDSGAARNPPSRRRPLLWLAALALLAPACQSPGHPSAAALGDPPREAAPGQASESPGTASAEAEHSLSSAGGHGGPQPGATRDSGRAGAPSTPSSTDASHIDPENRVLNVTLSALCVRRGDLLVVRLEGPPRAGISIVIGFSDNQAHGALFTGESDDAGRFDWHVPIAPTVPPGPAKLLASTTGPDWEREGGGSAQGAFTVAEGSC